MNTITVTGIVTKAHLARTKSEGSKKYLPDGSIAIYEVLSGEVPETVDRQAVPILFKKGQAPRLFKKNTLVHLQGTFVTLGRKLALSVSDINFLTPSATRKVLEAKGVDLNVERKHLAENNQFAVNDAIKSGNLPELSNLYSQDVQALDRMLDKGGLHTDIETPYQIVDFFEHRAKTRGFEAVTEMVLKNPYVLAEVEGLDYEKAHIIAKSTRWEHPDAPIIRLYAQLTAAAWSYARSGGHSYIPLAHAKVRLNPTLLNQLGGRTAQEQRFLLANLSTEIQKRDNAAAAHLVSSGSNEFAKEVGDYFTEHYGSRVTPEKLGYYGRLAGSGIYLARAYFSERYSAELFANRCGKDSWDDAVTLVNTTKMQKRLDPAQLKAVTQALTNKVSIIVGAAGSGKTHTTAELIRLLQQTGRRTCILAPSAMAASVAGQKTGIQDMEYQTLHRFSRILNYSDDLGTKELAIAPGEREDLLNYQCIIVDEMSMCDIPTFYAFLYALKENTTAHIVLVGDPAQLPAIGPSGFFQQMVRGVLGDVVPVTTLQGNHRSGNSLNQFAISIRKGTFALPAHDESITALPESMTAIIETVQTLKDRGCSPLDMLVLTTRKHNPAGTQQLNIALRRVFLPHAKPIGKSAFFVGDPVIAIKNDYTERVLSANQKSLRHPDRNIDVYNGTRGVIIAYNEETESVHVRYRNINGEYDTWYTVDELPAWIEPAYALTVHKAQGSEAPYVIFTRSRPGESVSRNMVYTAVTRAKKALWMVGSDWQDAITKEMPDPYSKFAFRVKAIWDKKALSERFARVEKNPNVIIQFG